MTYKTKQKTSSDFNCELHNYVKTDHEYLWHKHPKTIICFTYGEMQLHISNSLEYVTILSLFFLPTTARDHAAASGAVITVIKITPASYAWCMGG